MKVAVFPFENIILFPHTTIPIFVYDEHYIRLVKTAVESDIPIAVGLGDPIHHLRGPKGQDYLRPKEVMGLAEAEILKEFADGTLYVLMKGIGKVNLRSVVQQIPFLICNGEIIHDEPIDEILDHAPIMRFKDILARWMVENMPNKRQREIILDQLDTPEKIVDYLSCLVIEYREARQLLLESRNILEKINLLEGLLQDVMSKKRIASDPIATRQIVAFNHIEQNFSAVQ